MVITRTARAASTAGPEDRHRLGVFTGIAALGLDALASCAYGPEAIVLALAAAGAAGIALTLPVTLLIVALLAVLVASYRQVIAAYPDGGGAYTVARRNLGQRAGLVAAASLVVDYVLNVAVSVSAGVAALTSAFPVLLPWTLELCLAALLLVAGVNLRGVLTGGRAFAVPAAIFVGALVVLIVVGLLRGEPLHPLPPAQPDRADRLSRGTAGTRRVRQRLRGSDRRGGHRQCHPVVPRRTSAPGTPGRARSGTDPGSC